MLKLLSSLTLAALLLCSSLGAAETLKLALDKENLPYSSRRGDPAGLDAELAAMIVHEMGADLVIEWIDTLDDGTLSPLFGRKGATDFAVDVPIEPRAIEELRQVGQDVLYSMPYASTRYMLATRADAKPYATFADTRPEPLGAELGSVAGHDLAEAGYATRNFGSQDRILDALADGTLKIGVVWPNAGWRVEHDEDLRKAIKLQPADPGLPGLRWNIGLAVAPARRELLPRLDAAALKLGREGRIKPLYEKYRMPYFEPFDEKGKEKPRS